MPNECVSDKFVDDLAHKLNTDKKDEVDLARKMYQDCGPAISVDYAQQRIFEQNKLKAQQDGKEDDDIDDKPNAKDQVQAIKLAPQVYQQAMDAFARRVADRQDELKAEEKNKK